MAVIGNSFEGKYISLINHILKRDVVWLWILCALYRETGALIAEKKFKYKIAQRGVDGSRWCKTRKR